MKKRDPEEFAVKQAILATVSEAAQAGKCRLIFFDEATFSASPPVQRAWSPLGQPHRAEPAKHCKRSVLGALDFGRNALHHTSHACNITREHVINFLDGIIREGTRDQITLLVLDNARIHHNIPDEVLDRWLRDHMTLLFYLPPYSPELNLIEIVWNKAKYNWRRFITWTRDSFDQELASLLNGYGSRFQISFS